MLVFFIDLEVYFWDYQNIGSELSFDTILTRRYSRNRWAGVDTSFYSCQGDMILVKGQ
jgi:hypothetical protein